MSSRGCVYLAKTFLVSPACDPACKEDGKGDIFVTRRRLAKRWMGRVPACLSVSNPIEGLASALAQYCTDWAANGHSCSLPVAVKRGDVGDVVEAADGCPPAALLSAALQFRDQPLQNPPRYQPPLIMSTAMLTDPGTVVYGQSPTLTRILTSATTVGESVEELLAFQGHSECCLLLPIMEVCE